jgi:zinc protease
LTKPRFDAEAVARMRAANISRIKQSIGDADWISTRLLYDAVYKGHPYALNAGGTIASMQALTADDLRAEWARIAAVDTLVVSMTGDVKKEDAIKIVDDVFGALPARVGDVVLQKAEMPESGKPLFYAYDMPQSVLSMAWDGVGVNDPDYYAATVMNYIFGGGGFSSRLMDEVREKRGLTYGISSQMLNDVYADRYVVSASMQPQNVKGTIEAVKSIAQGLIDAPINADELQAAKDYLVGSLPVSLSSSMRIANALTVLQLADRSPNFFDAYNAKIQSVTQADIARVAKRVFSKPPIIVMVGAKPAAMDFETIVTLPNTEKPTP